MPPVIFLEFITPFHHMDVFRRCVHSIENFAQELVALEIVFYGNGIDAMIIH